MKLTTSWTCPGCGEKVPTHLDALSGVDNGSRIKVRIRVPDAALVDAFAHGWTHLSSPPAGGESRG